MKNPTTTALDASAERLRLVSQVGVDCIALALDAADSTQASDSLMKMLSHQLAALHVASMDYIAKANLQPDPGIAIKSMNLALRAMATYQTGVIAVKRMKSSGTQQIVIKHIDVSDGGQCAIGNMPSRGTGSKS